MQTPGADASPAAFRRVPAGHGVQWFSTAWQLLFQKGAAWVWIAMYVIAFVLGVIAHFVPLIGSFVGQIVVFVLAGGLMLAARKTEGGTVPSVADLFAGFGPPFGSLVLASVLLLIGAALVFGALAMAGVTAFLTGLAGLAYGGGPVTLAGMGATSLLLAVAALLLLIPLSLAWWLAPALIVLRNQPPLEALKSSLAAGWANLNALTVCGLVWIGAAIVATMALVLGWLVLGPLSVLVTYCAYRDLFESE